ncbi:uncharacterized protein ACNLHF_026397 isoform 2-T3 [Anomaloglossus baeobatrachus]|uniref:uncharacterized protein LOC142246580 isoform X2 n=1 Tax=Anomaloglossus baeobatrachus TaxID=238106 RepID=UPI003F4F9A3B
MDALADQIGRVRLGPVPLTFVFCVALVPMWTSFSSYDTSLLFSMFIIISVIVKGSLLSCWILTQATSRILQVTSVLGVMVAQMFLLMASLHASLFSVVVLIPPSTFTGICICKSLLRGRRDDKHEDPVPGPRSRSVIGIFSRSSQEEYTWLASMLSRAGRVVPFCITNSNAHQFSQQVPQCTFAILYHSKTRGRVNITNVTDSLYDEELSFMSKVLGKSNVIVVADDMDDGSAWAAQNILTNQPAIAQLTSGIYLFTTKEKMDNQLIKDKVQLIYNLFSQGSASDIVADVVLIFLVVAPWLYFIYFVYHVFFLITTNLSGSFLMVYATRAPNHRDSVLPSTYPIKRLRNSPRSWGTKKGARTLGLAAVLVLVVVELSSLYWVEFSIHTVLLMAQSLGTGVFFLIC